MGLYVVLDFLFNSSIKSVGLDVGFNFFPFFISLSKLFLLFVSSDKKFFFGVFFNILSDAGFNFFPFFMTSNNSVVLVLSSGNS